MKVILPGDLVVENICCGGVSEVPVRVVISSEVVRDVSHGVVNVILLPVS